MTAATGQRWFNRPREVARPVARLLCFPHAGRGGSMFRLWSTMLPDDVELLAVNLPGRESRMDEPTPVDLDALVAEIAEAAQPLLSTVPIVLFGHSFGALVAFELSHRLRADSGITPRCLIVSGCRPPHRGGPPIARADLPDDEFIGELRSLGGTPEEVLSNRDAMPLLLPAIRADFRLVETYVYRDRNPLACPIVALAGTGDPHADPDEMVYWRDQTSDAFDLRRFGGGHFFLESVRPLVVSAVTQALLLYVQR